MMRTGTTVSYEEPVRAKLDIRNGGGKDRGWIVVEPLERRVDQLRGEGEVGEPKPVGQGVERWLALLCKIGQGRTPSHE